MKTIKLGDRVKTTKNSSVGTQEGVVIGAFVLVNAFVVMFDRTSRTSRTSSIRFHNGLPSYEPAIKWLKGYPKIKLQEGRCYWLRDGYVTKIPLFKSWKGGKR